jgi:hypothetical protein
MAKEVAAQPEQQLTYGVWDYLTNSELRKLINYWVYALSAGNVFIKEAAEGAEQVSGKAQELTKDKLVTPVLLASAAATIAKAYAGSSVVFYAETANALLLLSQVTTALSVVIILSKIITHLVVKPIQLSYQASVFFNPGQNPDFVINKFGIISDNLPGDFEENLQVEESGGDEDKKPLENTLENRVNACLLLVAQHIKTQVVTGKDLEKNKLRNMYLAYSALVNVLDKGDKDKSDISYVLEFVKIKADEAKKVASTTSLSSSGSAEKGIDVAKVLEDVKGRKFAKAVVTFCGSPDLSLASIKDRGAKELSDALSRMLITGAVPEAALAA